MKDPPTHRAWPALATRRVASQPEQKPYQPRCSQQGAAQICLSPETYREKPDWRSAAPGGETAGDGGSFSRGRSFSRARLRPWGWTVVAKRLRRVAPVAPARASRRANLSTPREIQGRTPGEESFRRRWTLSGGWEFRREVGVAPGTGGGPGDAPLESKKGCWHVSMLTCLALEYRLLSLLELSMLTKQQGKLI